MADWLRASRGAETQEHLAEDITKVTGWNITRDRYSKYESGSLPIGRTVLQHFTDYWASRGVGGPDLSPQSVKDQPADPQAELIQALVAQTVALTELAAQVKALAERQPSGEELSNVLAAAVGLAVRETLRVSGAFAEPPQP